MVHEQSKTAKVTQGKIRIPCSCEESFNMRVCCHTTCNSGRAGRRLIRGHGVPPGLLLIRVQVNA